MKCDPVEPGAPTNAVAPVGKAVGEEHSAHPAAADRIAAGPLLSATDSRWLGIALADFDAVLDDHAHCEKKAAATAMALLSAHPENDHLVRAMSKLAQEELRHFQQVVALLHGRGLHLRRDRGDPYAQKLLQQVRKPCRLLDRLLVAALIEARSAERLSLLGAGLADDGLRKFYHSLSVAEAGHHLLFVRLAEDLDPTRRVEVHARLDELAVVEAQIVAELPLLPRIH